MKRVITLISSGVVFCILACNTETKKVLKEQTDEQASVVKVTGCDHISYKIVTNSSVSYK